MTIKKVKLNYSIECFHMTSRRPYWCPKTMKRRPCWCPKPVLWELNSFLMQTLSFVPMNLHRCWLREWKHSIERFTSQLFSLCPRAEDPAGWEGQGALGTRMQFSSVINQYNYAPHCIRLNLDITTESRNWKMFILWGGEGVVCYQIFYNNHGCAKNTLRYSGLFVM